MKILSATYGEQPITELISSKINGDKLLLKVNNDIIGDPQPGTLKYLKVEYEHNGEILNASYKENTICSLPKSKTNKLGIFYSNNNNATIYPTIQKSLEMIEKSAKNKADILTCVWNHIPNNPFSEIISWYHSQSHLNQLLQIMQCLYTAREMGNYDYVSFLEHDVLYAEGYFDYPEFESGNIYTNMNFIGVNKEGWQPLGQRDEPFHQMTMKFDDAIKHCERIIGNALIRNSGMIEPQDMNRKQWESPNPSVHVNHGHHFTSHYSIYRKADTTYNSYWGEHSEYIL